jgi:hypothetical protein
MPTGKPYQANDKDRGKLEVLLEMDLPLQQIAQRIGVSIPTLQKHYGDVIEATGLRPGRSGSYRTIERQPTDAFPGGIGSRPHPGQLRDRQESLQDGDRPDERKDHAHGRDLVDEG